MVLNRSSAVLEPICCPSCNSTGEHGNRDEGKQRYRCHNSDFGCIKEGDATLHRSLEQGDAFFTVEGIAVGVVQPQAAQPVAFGTAKLPDQSRWSYL